LKALNQNPAGVIASYETTRQQEITNIETNTKAELAKLDAKYSTAKSATAGISYIVFIFLGTIYLLSILNDLERLYEYLKNELFARMPDIYPKDSLDYYLDSLIDDIDLIDFDCLNQTQSTQLDDDLSISLDDQDIP
jgi:hypothetical protein